MNKVNISIYDDKLNEWIDYTKYTVLPFKGADIYDEQLDECELQLERISVKAFTPLSKVKLEIVNTSSAKFSLTQFNKIKARCDNPQNYTFIHNSDGTITVKRLIYMFVANDNAEEKPIGSDRYSHKIYLIELTKLLEGFIGDTVTFTNPLGNNYTEKNGLASCYVEYKDLIGGFPHNESYTFISSFFPSLIKFTTETTQLPTVDEVATNEERFKILGLENYSSKSLSVKNAAGENIPLTNNGANFSVGVYTATYHYYTSYATSGSFDYQQYDITYTFEVLENRLPPKKWTITDVINRVLETVEPLRIDERPRFYLNGILYIGEPFNLNGQEVYSEIATITDNNSTAEKLDKILAPEFAFSKMTAREMLQQIGGRIHAEPRLLMREHDNSKYYIVDYDFYGLTKKSHISERPHILSGSSIDINNYCTSLDSSADNLINSLDYAQNVIIEPFIGGYKTVRAEQVAIRMSESDGGAEIETTLPIYLQPQVTVKYDGETYDISAYIFEKTDYDNLSSYDGTFPYAKAYALYYEQGKKNIKGLFFKAPDAVNPVFKKYAISNIIKAVTGENVDFALGNGGINTDALLGLEFQVSYLPIVQQRVKTNKSIVNKGLPRTIAYNQGANSIETRYYGENLKGVISRLGNVEKTFTYALAFISDIPQIGTKFDDTYYITNVAYEILPTYIRCTVALSENFNRHSEYVGINSEKRMWEVSERQALERDYIKTEYLYITADNTSINPQAINPLLAIKPLTALLDKNQQKVSLATVKGYTKQLNPIRDYYLAMPVVASSFGNAMTFSFAFEDNYNAGKKITNANNNAYGGYTPYTDNYGRLYYLDLTLGNRNFIGINSYDKNDLPLASQSLVNYNNSNAVVKTGNNLLTFRKDNREIPTITYELQAVSDGTVIIGSALMRNSGLVNSNPLPVKYVTLSAPLNVISSEIDLNSTIREISFNTFKTNVDFENGTITIPKAPQGDNPVAWALITEQITTQIKVADENGNETTQEIVTGGELLIGQNTPPNGQIVKFIIKSDIYPKT